MPEREFSPPPRNHNSAPYWSEVFSVEKKLKHALRNIARGKAWEKDANRLNLSPIAQNVVIAKQSYRPFTETREEKRLRESVGRFERYLLALRVRCAEKYGLSFGSAANFLLDEIDRDIAVTQKYRLPPRLTPRIFVAQAISREIEMANRRIPPTGRPIPAGLGATGIIVGLTCEAMKMLNKPDDADAVRKDLTEKCAMLVGVEEVREKRKRDQEERKRKKSSAQLGE